MQTVSSKQRRSNTTSIKIVPLQSHKSARKQVVSAAKFEDHIDDWIKFLSRKRLSKFTIANYTDHLKVIEKYLPTDVSITTLTAEVYETLVFDPMRDQGLSANTINGRIKALRQWYNFLIAIRLVSHNIANDIQLVKKRETGIPSLSKEQMVALLKQPDLGTFTGFRDYTVIKLMFDCGIRLREATDLTVSQVDLSGRRLREVYGKNGRCEDIPLSRPMCKQLESYLEERGSVASDALFVTIDGAPLSRRNFQERLSAYGAKADIQNVRVSPHTLRHTFAKQWVLNGGDPFSLQRILRHSTMDMVKRYIYLWADELQNQHDKFSPILNLSNDKDA